MGLLSPLETILYNNLYYKQKTQNDWKVSITTRSLLEAGLGVKPKYSLLPKFKRAEPRPAGKHYPLLFIYMY